jgi:tetratricopeptide (TPR) repeat protein
MTTPDGAFERAWARHQAGDFRAAEEAYRKILQTQPRNGRVWFVLGNLCAAQGRLAEAAACIRQALEIEPREAMGHLHLGNVLLQQEQFPAAEAAYRRCLQIQPGHVEALVNLGFALSEQDRLDEARACYEQARALAPGLPEVHHNLGNVLREQGRLDEALASYDEALRLRPDYVKAHVNKGVALVARCEVEAAVASLRRGVELQPDFAEAHNSLGTALSAQGHLDEALAQYEEAIRLKPDYPDAHWNRSLVRLLQGDYERGWPDYEWRWRCKRTTPLPALSQPRWDGGPLGGRTVLLYAEQGLGDTLQFVRYAPLVQQKGGRVVLQCQGALVPLLARCRGLDEIIPWGAPAPACDAWAPLLSLPGLFGTTLAAVPAEVPYLFADPALVEHWRRQFAAVSGFTVGIAWQGSPRHAWDRHRSAPLACFEPLARVPGVRLIGLQQGPGREQLGQAAFPVADFGDLVDRTAGAFMDTAAILHSLDLVVTIDTALAHLGGGWGCRCGWRCTTRPTGAGCGTATTARGIRPPACSGSPRWATGPRSSARSPTSCAAWPPTPPGRGRCWWRCPPVNCWTRSPSCRSRASASPTPRSCGTSAPSWTC